MFEIVGDWNMTEGQSRGNGSVFQITGKFKITEFKLARSNCILRRTPASTVRSNKCI